MTAPLPRIDPYLASIGEPLEDLSAIGPAQPFASGGPTLPRDDLDVLVKASERRLRKVAPTPALVAAELMDESGTITAEGRMVVALLARPTARIRVESGRGRAPLTLAVHLRDGAALVLATASPASLVDPPHGADLLEAATTVGLDLVDVTAVPARIASWVGLAPAWRLATEPTEIDHDLLLSRVDDARTLPPEDADAHLRHVWGQHWFLWTLQSSAFPTGRVWVNTGTTGHFLVTETHDGKAEFASRFSQEVWADLLGFVGRTLQA